VDFDYEPAVLAGLAGHGLKPRGDTIPEFLREAVSDLYRYEIRALRTALLAGRVQKAQYVEHVLGLRKKYWLLSVPLQLWTRPEPGPGSQADVR
jgi:hypothetical protein